MVGRREAFARVVAAAEWRDQLAAAHVAPTTYFRHQTVGAELTTVVGGAQAERGAAWDRRQSSLTVSSALVALHLHERARERIAEVIGDAHRDDRSARQTEVDALDLLAIVSVMGVPASNAPLAYSQRDISGLGHADRESSGRVIEELIAAIGVGRRGPPNSILDDGCRHLRTPERRTASGDDASAQPQCRSVWRCGRREEAACRGPARQSARPGEQFARRCRVLAEGDGTHKQADDDHQGKKVRFISTPRLRIRCGADHTFMIAKHCSRLLIGSRPGLGRCSCATNPVYPDSAIALAMKR